MIDPELNNRIAETFDTCALHLKRMEYAKSKVKPFIPISRENYYRLDDDTIGFLI